MKINRRTLLKKAAVATPLSALLSGLPAGWVGTAYADDSPETSTMRFGIIALTDNAAIVMAHELGHFKKFGINSVISKEASWAVIRDKLTLGENHATHMLLGMPFASSMGLLGSPVKPMVIPWMLNRNGQAITLANKFKGKVKTAKDMKPFVDQAKAAGDPLTFAMTFPPGTHAMWIRTRPAEIAQINGPEERDRFASLARVRWHTAATIISANASRRGSLLRAFAFRPRGAARAPLF